MKIVLDHKDSNNIKYILKHKDYTLEETIKITAKLLLLGFEIIPSIGLSSKDVVGILVKCCGFSLDIKEVPNNFEELDYDNLNQFKDNKIYQTNLECIWDYYISPNTDMLKEEIGNNENGLSELLYKELCKVLRATQDKLFFEIFYENFKGQPLKNMRGKTNEREYYRA